MSNGMDSASSSEHLVDTSVKFNLFHASVASSSRLSASGEISHNTKGKTVKMYWNKVEGPTYSRAKDYLFKLF